MTEHDQAADPAPGSTPSSAPADASAAAATATAGEAVASLQAPPAAQPEAKPKAAKPKAAKPKAVQMVGVILTTSRFSDAAGNGLRRGRPVRIPTSKLEKLLLRGKVREASKAEFERAAEAWPVVDLFVQAETADAAPAE